MTVYVDDMYRFEMGKFRGMRMSHMVADRKSELLAMADHLDLQRRWIQYPSTPRRCHFDISFSKRRLAVTAGAVEITWRELALKTCEIDV